MATMRMRGTEASLIGASAHIMGVGTKLEYNRGDPSCIPPVANSWVTAYPDTTFFILG